ncbi:hypothetical protein SAMN06272722_11175 [Paenibacillus sp. RU5A]|nr:hypothetical protein SAMN06272722_11175 [Paenibacillus sp. RU5A]SOC74726.1 hypothetical protein SAMN05880581_11175 [Paenibacillus sp. RU26A]SOC76863.1 hypothetical protein SAMN05880586_11175 [Paenibacillus sp. RU5M]
MVFLYIIGSFIGVWILSWIFSIIGINIFEGPSASAFFFYGSIIIGILLCINDKIKNSVRNE